MVCVRTCEQGSPLLRTEWFIDWYILKVALPKGGELCAEKGNRKPFSFTVLVGSNVNCVF